MRRIAQILGAVRYQMRACREYEREPERPISFAEITAASAFLDFGGIPDGCWSHGPRLREWEDFLAARARLAVPPRALREPIKNNFIGHSPDGRTNNLRSEGSEACCVRY
jgi:hypothetical protein